MLKKTKMMYMLNKLREEMQHNYLNTKETRRICEQIVELVGMLRNSVIVDKNALSLNVEIDYNHSDMYAPLSKKVQLISKKTYLFRENNDGEVLSRMAEVIKEDLLEAIEERIDEDENN